MSFVDPSSPSRPPALGRLLEGDAGDDQADEGDASQ